MIVLAGEYFFDGNIVDPAWIFMGMELRELYSMALMREGIKIMNHNKR